MSRSAPEVSVVIPTYNCARYVGVAIESVLAQTFKNFEVLVIDDGSTDDTAAVVGRYGSAVRYLRQPNGGVAVARNRGIAESGGRYLAFLDADDTWLPAKLERHLAALGRHPGYRASYAAYTLVDQDLKPLAVRRCFKPELTLEDLLFQGNRVGSLCTVLCERSVLESVGGFDPALSQCADWDLWVRVAGVTHFLAFDEPLVTYRQHGTNMSRNARLLETDSLRVLSKAFDQAELLPALRDRRRAAFARNYRVLAGTYFHAGHYRDFVRCAAHALALDAREVRYMMAYPARVAARLRGPRLSEVS